MRYIIGLTGGIGTGKSLCTEFLQNKNIHIIDADSVGHSVLLPGGAAYDEVSSAFGCLNPDGTINRRELGAIVFSSPNKLELLNTITHPAIKKLIVDEINAHTGIIVLECALLYESGFDSLVNETWLVCTKNSIRESRIMKRDNLSIEAVRARIASQSEYMDAFKNADVIITNNGSTADLEKHLELEYRMLIERINNENV